MDKPTTDFYNLLLAEILATGEVAWIQTLLAQAITKITTGVGELTQLKSAGLQGKSFQMDVLLTPLQIATACRRAITATAPALVTGGLPDVSKLDEAPAVTYADFRFL